MTFDERALVPDAILALIKYNVPRPSGIVARMDANESPFVLDRKIQRALAEHISTVALNRYPDSEQPGLRKYFSKTLYCEPDQLCFGNGSDEIIALLMATFCGRGGCVAFPTPTFAYYRIAAATLGVSTIEVPLASDFAIDWAVFENKIAAQPVSLVFFALPNNPTGTLWVASDVAAFAERHPNLIVVSDEAYFEYAHSSLVSELARLPNLVIMRTLSKVGLAALRIGIAIASRAIISHLEKVRPPYNIGSLNQASATWLVENHRGELDKAVAATIVERQRLATKLAKIADVHVFPSRANFLLFRYGTGTDARASQLWQTLVDRGVLVRNLDRANTPLAGCLRVTIGTRQENELFLEGVRS